MKILDKYVIKNLTLNKRRTLSVGIAIALSTSLICSILIIAVNYYINSLNDTILSKGNYYTTFIDVRKNENNFIVNNEEVLDYFVTQEVGYVDLNDSKGKDFISVLEFDERAINNSGIRLLEGRMPKNSNELVISEQVAKYGEVNFRIGEKVNFSVNQLLLDGEYTLRQGTTYLKSMLKENRLTKKHIYNREYIIVGIIKRPETGLEPYNAAGYTAITTLDNLQDYSSYWVKFKNINKTFELTDKLSQENKCAYRINYDLLNWYGVSEVFNFIFMGIVIVIAIIIVIVICSILAIKSSFILSFSEKKKQYGILLSIGAKQSQLKKLNLKENVIISIISIFIGIVMGIGLAYVLILILESITENIISQSFNVPLWVLAITIIFSSITIYFSSRSAIKKIKGISPINSIRENEEIKIDKNNIRITKCIKKLFGIGGVIAYKNIRRNKKKYEATLISLIISISLFIGLNSFVSYSTEISNNFYQGRKYNVIIGYKSFEDEKEKFKTLTDITKMSDINSYMFGRYKIILSDLSSYIDSSNLPLYKTICSRDNMVSFNIQVLGEKEYTRFVQQIGEDYSKCKDGVIYIKGIRDYVSDSKKRKVQLLNIKKGDVINGNTLDENDSISLKVMATTNMSPMGYENMATPLGRFIISDELFDKLFDDYRVVYIAAQSDDPDNLCKKIQNNYDNILAKNLEEEIKKEEQTKLVISIILYGVMFIVIVIAITNIFNIIISNIYLRKKEFAMLKSIGMTKKEFSKMINLETLFYCIESIVIGGILGTIISSIIFWITTQIDTIEFKLPIISILIASVFILIAVRFVMYLGIKRISHNNIVDTIKNDNV